MWEFVKRRSTMLVVGTVSCLLIVAILNRRAIQVAYHARGLESAQRALYSKTRVINEYVGYGDLATFDRCDYHRKRLVELEYLTHTEYELTHIIVPTDESKHFTRLIVGRRCPLHVHFSSPSKSTPTQMKVNVWCLPDHVREWKEFIKAHDIPDYRARFMTPVATAKVLGTVLKPT